VTDKAWKRAERRICEAFGGKRRGPDGKGQSDCVDTDVSVQVKYSKRGTPYRSWIEDAKKHGNAEGKDWALVVIRPHQETTEALVVCSLDYLLRCRSSTPN
jgi:hypothetical protein